MQASFDRADGGDKKIFETADEEDGTKVGGSGFEMVVQHLIAHFPSIGGETTGGFEGASTGEHGEIDGSDLLGVAGRRQGGGGEDGRGQSQNVAAGHHGVSRRVMADCRVSASISRRPASVGGCWRRRLSLCVTWRQRETDRFVRT